MSPPPWELRVLPIPSAHAYPQSLRPHDAQRVVHLSDPPVPGAPEGVWWPPPALDAAWVEQHATEVDVVHLHFGFDASSPADLAVWCDALDRHGIPLVLTVHDLVNPHFRDQGEHAARLDVLVPRAASLVTLTSGAALEIARRWGRAAEVVPHPHVAPLELVGVSPDRSPDQFVVGLHLKSLRANVRVQPALDALVPAVRALPGAVLRVHLHREVLDPAHPRHDGALVADLRRRQDAGALDLVVHEPHTDDELWAYLRSLDVSVMPYAFGTHSGWLEACHDLGTAVLAPRVGFWGEQQRQLTFDWRADGSVDHEQVAAALRQAYADRPTWAARPADRVRQQHEVATAHTAIYRAAWTGRSAEPAEVPA
ncbi:MAG: glycosyltransferase [Lapillicoccus sp.]